jgi:hypothetical protein
MQLLNYWWLSYIWPCRDCVFLLSVVAQGCGALRHFEVWALCSSCSSSSWAACSPSLTFSFCAQIGPHMRQRGAVCVMVLPHEIHVRRYFFWCGDVQWLGDRCCRRRTEEGSVGYGRRGTALYLHCDPHVSVIHFYFSPICYLACSVMAISHSWTCTEIGARSHVL